MTETEGKTARQQDVSGNALEYAVAMQVGCFLGSPIKADNVSEKAREDFHTQSVEERIWLMRAGGAGVAHVMEIEKARLKFKANSAVIMQPDNKGREGDPRDILLSLEKGHLGFSVKRKNDVEKNQRLQRNNTNFGKMWGLGVDASPQYAKEVEAVFKRVDAFRKKGAVNWKDISNSHEKIYLPLLQAFQREFETLAGSPEVCEKFVYYVTGGAFDFYKIMAYDKKAIVQGYNFGGKLSCYRLRFPKLLLSVGRRDEDSKTTIVLTFDGGWVFSMRIHNGDTRIVDSLKWDVRLIAHPVKMYSHHIILP
ncbi:MAG: HaeIII family restriction endonuclease [Gammaproteobacteria bacterium]